MRDFYLVGNDYSVRVGDPGTELYDDSMNPATTDDIQGGGKNVRIIILTPDRFRDVKKLRSAGTRVTWNNPPE